MADKKTRNPEYVLFDVFTKLYNVLHIFYAADIYLEKQCVMVTCCCELVETPLDGTNHFGCCNVTILESCLTHIVKQLQHNAYDLHAHYFFLPSFYILFLSFAAAIIVCVCVMFWRPVHACHLYSHSETLSLSFSELLITHGQERTMYKFLEGQKLLSFARLQRLCQPYKYVLS